MPIVRGVQRTAYSYARFSTLQQEEGDSERRQIDDARAYATANGFALDESIGVDRGKSAYHGKNLSEGALGEFIKRIEAGQIARGSVLLVESPDRLSRQPFSDCWPTYQRILKGDIEIHFLFIRRVLKPDHSFVDLLQIGVEIDRGNSESANKSDRIGKAWRMKKAKAVDRNAITASTPHWLRATRGEKVVEIPDRAATIRKIFQLAALGLGGTRIIKKLIADGDKPFGNTSRWNLGYIQAILANRAVIGEYQPLCHKNGKKIPEGDPIPDFYPRVVSYEEWEAARAVIADKNIRARHKNGGSRGGGRQSNDACNLFTGLIRDNGRPMYFNSKGAGTRPAYLVTSLDDKGSPSNRLRYDWFEKRMLRALYEIDWEAVAGEADSAELKAAAAELDRVAGEIDRTERLIATKTMAMDDENLDVATQRIFAAQIARATEKLATMGSRRVALNAEIDSVRTKTQALYNPQALLDVVAGGDAEVRLRLKSEIRKRLTRIELHFNSVYGFEPGVPALIPAAPGRKGDLFAVLTFGNGAQRIVSFNPLLERLQALNGENVFP